MSIAQDNIPHRKKTLKCCGGDFFFLVFLKMVLVYRLESKDQMNQTAEIRKLAGHNT